MSTVWNTNDIMSKTYSYPTHLKISTLVIKNVMQGAWGWCTGMTQRDGMGREVGGAFRMWNTCTPVVELC